MGVLVEAAYMINPSDTVLYKSNNFAYNAAKGLIGKYSLEPNYEDLFTKTESHTSVESIWPVMFKENQRHWIRKADYEKIF